MNEIDEVRKCCEILPDSLNRPLSERIRLLLERAERESQLAVRLHRRLEEVDPQFTTQKPLICKHCQQPITRWDDASFWEKREVYTHDDLVDGSSDRPRNGVACRDGEHDAEPSIEQCG
jgi:hypothetical protein